ncbi:MAG: M48 family metalloprotease [Deltaproteobacteria bacterium]|nr:MAG: M48 family metalloprotease [Deltaproteobacteria bacterium]
MTVRKPWKLLIYLVALLIVVGPQTRLAQADLSIEEEKKIGRKFLKAALSQLRLIQDPEVVGYVNRVGQDVVKHLEVHAFPYHFYVVDSSALNAFAAPAGYVFMNRGLIEIMDDEGELAAILAHEIAHVQSRHIAQRMARARALNLAALGGMLAGIFLGGEAGAAAIAGSQAGATSAMLNYSRQDEEEADRKGLRYLEAANYSGEDFVKIMRKMGQDSWKAGGHIPTYLTTHPGVSERVVYLATTAATRPTSAQVRTMDSEGFMLMQVKLYGSYEIPKEAEPKFREWFERPETRAMAYYGRGLMRRRQRLMDEAVKSFKNAIALRPDLAPILVELGETYFEMGELEKAQQVLNSALTLEPDQPVALYALGRCQLEQGQVAEASKQLERAAKINDRLPSIHYYLGLAYGKMNQLADAHYHFGIHYKRKGSLRNAQFHFQEALRFTDSPKEKEAIKRQLAEIKGAMRAAKQRSSRNR